MEYTNKAFDVPHKKLALALEKYNIYYSAGLKGLLLSLGKKVFFSESDLLDGMTFIIEVFFGIAHNDTFTQDFEYINSTFNSQGDFPPPNKIAKTFIKLSWRIYQQHQSP